ncbi:MAG: hypothetical protein HYZ28_27390 [Myxococcales bacterium]|nr:hypothetical protein [Myxococcales bacterium]
MPVSFGTIRSGQCACSSLSTCPPNGTGGLQSDQDCLGNVCTCDGTNAARECPPGARCTEVEGFTSPGFCHY